MMQLERFTFNPFSENTYLIHDSQQATLIDPGCFNASEQAVLEHYLKEHGLVLGQVVLTHAHIDHILGLSWIYDRFGIKATMHENERTVFARAVESAMLFGIPYDPAPEPDCWEKGKKSIELAGDVWEMRDVPGHSPGSVLFIHHNAQTVIGGDVLFRESIGRTDLPGGDFPTLEKSIREQLYTLPEPYTVFPGHGPETTIGHEKRFNPFVQGT